MKIKKYPNFHQSKYLKAKKSYFHCNFNLLLNYARYFYVNFRVLKLNPYKSGSNFVLFFIA